MPRPKANPEQHLQAYRLWQTGKGHTEIAVALEHEFANAVSERTISTWIRGFKALTPQTADLDSPFEWHRLGCYGLPWEASDFLLEMWRVIVTGQLIPVPVAPPTTRQMIWFWRVHLAVPELLPTSPTAHGIIALAQDFLQRELRHELLAEPLNMEDLSSYIASSPWRSPEHRFNYENAVAEGLLPQLQQPNTVGLEAIPGIPYEGSEGGSPAEDMTSFLAWAIHQVKEGVTDNAK